MDPKYLTVVDLGENAATHTEYNNTIIAGVNDHVVRLSVMTEPYFWHSHPDSDETFLVVEGSVFIDLIDRTIELFPNQLFTIPKAVRHRTRPNGHRSVNLTFESAGMTTVKADVDLY